ncbi:MAG: beta galactosidase jelly roll domain-containing protein [Acidimicrobiales bacterium]|nr:beta galactosidase jelly roll domain-containing protein [Acidimicrobiales bacterium]
MRVSFRPRGLLAVATLGLLGLVPVGLGLTDTPAGAATVNPGDGTSSPTAGASCWGIKQQYPSSNDGIYWLLTPAMDRPAQFYCDMTTDGGGWVLIARGRENWTFSPKGQGSPTTLRTTVDGPAAFAPAALDKPTIEGLRNNSNLSTEPDGIRLERAMNASGTTRQDYRLFPKAHTWDWNFPYGQLLNSVRINGTTYNGSNTKDTADDTQGQTVNGLANKNDSRRLVTTSTSDNDNKPGFGTGWVWGGSDDPDTYLWSSGWFSDPIPFTRVWLRPHIANNVTGFTPIPAAGFPEHLVPTNLKDRPELAPWGVVGVNHTDEAPATGWDNNVMAIEVVGDRVLVGGRFTGVQNGPGAPEISQPSLAAFDLNGNWISSFTPQIDNGRVWDIQLTPSGKVMITGDFTSVNGTSDTSNIAMIDPITGAVDPTWRASATFPGGSSNVRAVAIRGNWVYAVGRFTEFKGGNGPVGAVSNAISFRLDNGARGTWHPTIYATAVAVKVSGDGTRVFLAGHFNSLNGDTNHGWWGITNITDGSPVAGMGPFQASAGTTGDAFYQQAVGETADGNLLVGGSQHDLQMYDSNRDTLLNSHITKEGGDFQAIEVIDGYVYASCHCMNWNYSGTNDWRNPTDFERVDGIRMVGRYDEKTLEYDATWWPNGTKGSNDAGIWTIDSDSRRCLWVGGDLVRGDYMDDPVIDYLGGFARFCPTDAVAPTAPTNLKVSADQSGVTLTWSPSTDASGSVSYDVYRNDRVIAQVWGTSYRDNFGGNPAGATYTVRATDPRGNRSASPRPVTIGSVTASVGTAKSFGSTWAYQDDGSDQGTAWRLPGFDDSTWSTGAAPLGWGGAQSSAIGANKPTTAYFRTTFDVANPTTVMSVSVSSKLTQGAVLYLNGVEIGRFNMPSGDVSASTTATTYTCCAEDSRIKEIHAPTSLLSTGTNTLAVEVHGWKQGSGRMSFDARVVLG